MLLAGLFSLKMGYGIYISGGVGPVIAYVRVLLGGVYTWLKEAQFIVLCFNLSKIGPGITLILLRGISFFLVAVGIALFYILRPICSWA